MWSDLPLFHRVSGARQGYRTARDVAAQLPGDAALVAVAVVLSGDGARPGVARLRYAFRLTEPGREEARVGWVELDNHHLRASVSMVSGWTPDLPAEPLEMSRVEADVDEVLAVAFPAGAAAPRDAEVSLAAEDGAPVWRVVSRDGDEAHVLRVDALTGTVLPGERGAAP